MDFIRSAIYESEKRTGLRGVLTPLFLLSRIYGFIITLRRVLYKIGIFRARKLDAYVISVGNIIVGGTGKTPAVIYISRLLQRNGYKVCVLSRGYNGANKGEYLEVSDETEVLSDPKTAGDEPYMLAVKLKGIPVIVGRNRFIAGKRAVEKFKPDVCVLDDGFQHFKLKRDLDIVTFDGDIGLGNGHLLPNGIMREQLSALRRADVVLINKGAKKSDDIVSAVEKYKGGDHRIFFCGYETDGLTAWSGEKQDISYLSQKKIFVFSALAHSDYFHRIIERSGGIISGKLDYRDHHHYTIDDYFRIVKEAYNLNADFILTTEKDIVKFNRAWGENSKVGIFSLCINLKPVGSKELL
jgi:tetraacyldisaccharide 4'-kinase